MACSSLVPLVLLLLVLERQLSDATNTITIGALFDQYESDPARELAFRYGVERASSSIKAEGTSIVPRVERVPASNGFQTAKRVCHLLKVGVGAIIGPAAEPTAAHVRSLCDTKSVPHMTTSWRYRRRSEPFSVSLYPHAETLSQTYVDILETLRWTKFHVLYEDNNSLVRLQRVLRMMNTNNKISMTVRQLPANMDYRMLLKGIQNSGGTHLVVDCSAENIYQVLKQAQQIGMVTRYYHYFFTNLDLHTVDLHDFQFAGTNITGLRLVNTDDYDVIRQVQSWKEAEALRGRHVTVSPRRLSTEAALLYDAALLFAKAVDDLHVSRDIRVMSLNCDMDDLWPHGESVLNYMRNVEVLGLTGLVRFDTTGVRSHFSLDVVTLLDEGLVPLGRWTPEGFSASGADNRTRVVPSIKNQNLTVTTLLKEPYTMLKESSEELEGNDRYEGICVDLIEELAQALHFNYTIKPVPDNAPGKYDPETGRWNGMIGELLEGRADLAISDLTITFEREAVVDFTMQFMNLGISILYRKPTREPPSLFSFLSPLSLRVWLYMAGATMGVSLLMFVLARFTPYEWEPPHPCAPDQEQLQNNFNFLNCIWFCIGSLMQQGCDFLPKAVSTRMVAAMWWFFTLIMISSYTANLAAFLTVERLVFPITSVEDLAAQSSIKYGLYESGSTATFFRTSQIAPYNKMWQVMESQSPTVFHDTEEGIQRVKNDKGNFAYFMESSSIEYHVERDCELSQVGGLLDNKGYGIALPPDSPWTNQLNERLVYMQEQGKLAELKNKWWKNDGAQCSDDRGRSSSAASELDLENVGGVFVCLMGGMVVATLIAVVEFIFHLRDQASDDNTSVLSEMGRELRFILRCHGSTKPARAPPPAERRGSGSHGLVAFNEAAARKHSAAYGDFGTPAVS
ncbi:glutamate receptor ionotropic, kainate 2-like [Amphibalanus amphitrite]|uniref:glutamate receptor ionotropic, kainate 2-like n=1 Tax=Amphibalanus amphitrite TaxID=1232801 RepID=UPI001C911C21|nr:glutamate receptor ionotropic, kainate 2-like [Amphibalanus amphitrite]